MILLHVRMSASVIPEKCDRVKGQLIGSCSTLAEEPHKADETVDQWSDMLEQLNVSQALCTVLGTDDQCAAS